MKESVRWMPAIHCDAGGNEGMYRIDVRGSVYLTAEEYQRYLESGSDLSIQIGDRNE